MPSTRPTLTIIGCGHVGKSLARLWQKHQSLQLKQILNRTPESAGQAIRFIGAGQAAMSFSDLQPADLYMIGVPDDRIADCALQLADSGMLCATSIVFHCSGSLPSSMMQAVTQTGAAVASVHPIRSFSIPEQVVNSFSGTWCGIEGDPRALPILSRLFADIGAQLVPIKAEAKMLYHSAAVFASNYLVTLLDVAIQTYMQAGVPEGQARQMIEPLVRKTAENVFSAGCEKALSGPIARGDLDLVKRQAEAVEAWNEEIGDLYQLLAKLTLDLANRRT